MKGILRALCRLHTLIALPTTAGTGSEVTLAAVITDSEQHDKYALMSFPLIPRYAVLNPALTVSLPAHLTSTTGMDALTHAVEAYIGRSTTRETRSLSLEASGSVFANAKTAWSDGCNAKARENMLYAAYKAGMAFSQSYVGYIHAVAIPWVGCMKHPTALRMRLSCPLLDDSLTSDMRGGRIAGVATCLIGWPTADPCCGHVAATFWTFCRFWEGHREATGFLAHTGRIPFKQKIFVLE